MAEKRPSTPTAKTEHVQPPVRSVEDVLAWAQQTQPELVKNTCLNVCDAQGEPLYATQKGSRSKYLVSFRVGEEGLTAYAAVALPEIEMVLRQPIESEEGKAQFLVWLEKVGGKTFRESPISFVSAPPREDAAGAEAEPDAPVVAAATPATPPASPNLSERTTVAYLAKIREALAPLTNIDDQSPGAIARRDRFAQRLHEMFLQTGILERLESLVPGESEVRAQSGMQILQLNAPRVGAAVGRPAENPLDLVPTTVIRLYQRTQPVAGDHTLTELPEPYALKVAAVLQETISLEEPSMESQLKEALQELGATQVRVEIVAWREQAGEKRQIIVAAGGAFISNKEGTA